MVQTKAPRGRPIGTGIDDSDRIARLAELLKTQPDLKTTTAIRVMGFSDPSTIRRLRDKYKAFHTTAANPANGGLRAPRKVDAVLIGAIPQLIG
jgi:hypothetical protein